MFLKLQLKNIQIQTLLIQNIRIFILAPKFAVRQVRGADFKYENSFLKKIQA